MKTSNSKPSEAADLAYALDGDHAADLSVAAASALLASGKLQPETLLEAIFTRIDRVDSGLHSYLRSDRDAARKAARAAGDRARRGIRLSPLDGIPFAVKDNICTAGLPTTGGSRVPQHHDPDLTATMVQRLFDAGAILIGKLNTWEYGTGTGAVYFDLDMPPARNPWHPEHYTGGSSSGSGAAVAAGTALFALGTDTGGSVRLPAAACGIVGFKPTFGRISRYGIMPNSPSFDTPGPMTLTVEDAALVYDVIAGHDPLDPVSLTRAAPPLSPTVHAGVEGKVVGYVSNLDPGGAPPEAAILHALEQAAEALRAAGAVVRRISLPISPSEYRNTSVPINRSESASVNERDFLEHGHLMGRSLHDKLAAGRDIRATDYLAAQRQRQELIARTDALFADIDLLLLPMTYRAAPRLDDMPAVSDFTAGSAGSPFSLTGHPAVAVPAGFNEGGLPLSVQLAAGYFCEALLLQGARTLEKTFNPVPRRARVAVSHPAAIDGATDAEQAH
jgi:aspartyl-tRNA(Asn)/glutamyl-tRNA(Gln) amidotransferase subunit A